MLRSLTRAQLRLIRCVASESHVVGRQPFPQSKQKQSDDSEDGTPRFQPIAPLNLPSQHQTNVFPEEASQGYSVDDYPGMSVEPFGEEIANILQTPIKDEDVELKPDGALYLPEVKYRKILTQAFGPGGWSLIPRGPHTFHGNILSREYALFCRGRFMSQARGSATVQGPSNPAASTEAVRSNALMRCCKDLGIASELWDAKFVNDWKMRFAIRKHVTDRFGNNKILWVRA